MYGTSATQISRLGRLAALLLLAASGATPARGESWTGEIFYTRYNRAPGEPNVKSVPFTYVDGQLTLGTRRAIADVGGADGIAFAADGDLIIGGQEAKVHKVQPKPGGRVTTVSSGSGGAYHVAIDPSETKAWIGGSQPGQLVELPLSPFAAGRVVPLKGDDLALTHIVFDPDGNAYYTASTPRGGGAWGNIDMTTFTTKRVHELPAAHGTAWDPYTGTIFLFGEKHIAQFDPITGAIVSDLDLSAHPALNLPFKNELDQGTVDGFGHAFVAANNGNLVFVDYALSGLVADPTNIVIAQHLDSFLDDVAPIVGPGGRPTDPTVPRGVRKVTGGGTVPVGPGHGDKANFGFKVEMKNDRLSGQLNWVDHKNGDHIKAETIDVFELEGNVATFSGTCRNVRNPGAACTFRVHAEDNGEPGRNDVFRLSLNNGVEAGGTLRSGNVQVHVAARATSPVPSQLLSD